MPCALLLCCALVQESPPSGHTLWYDEPADRWVEALPVGNGRIGAMVHGGVDSERIQLNVDTLWAGSPQPRDRAGAAEHLDEIRGLLFAGEVTAAQALAQRELMSERWTRSYQTLGDLSLSFEHDGEPEDYRRWLDLDAGIAGVSYRVGDVVFEREVLASAPDDVIAIRLRASEHGALSGTIALDRPAEATADLRRGPFSPSPAPRLVLAGRVTQGGEHPGVRFAAAVLVAGDGSGVGGDGSRLVFEGRGELLLLVQAVTDYGRPVPRETFEESLVPMAWQAGPRAVDWPALRAAHVADHRALYRRCDVDLGARPGAALLPTDERLAAYRAGAPDPGLEALYFRYGRYLLMASSRPGTMPANLQGLWCEHVEAPWNADYHININCQMNYWPAEVANLAECHEPFFRLVDGIRKRGRVTARELYGCDGWVAHHTTDAWWFTSPIGRTVWGLWPTGGAWCTRHLFEHWAYGGDDAFLRERAWPVMAEAAEFFLDYLAEDPETGLLVSGPSSSPENTYVLPDGQRADVCMGAQMDQQIVWDLFTNVLEAADALALESDLVDRVRAARARLTPPRVGADGRLLEWSRPYEEAEPGHRHMSHLFGLHPGRQFGPGIDDELSDAARRSLEHRLAHGGGHTGWSRAWLVNFLARLHDGDGAHAHLAALLRKSTLPNLFDDHPPFQIDGNFGGCAGIAEMLVQSHAGTIHLLPALPDAWPEGSARGLRARGGVELDVTWADGVLREAELRASRGGTLVLRVGANDARARTEVEAGDVVRLRGRGDGGFDLVERPR